jgi:hypothetical protein
MENVWTQTVEHANETWNDRREPAISAIKRHNRDPKPFDEVGVSSALLYANDRGAKSAPVDPASEIDHYLLKPTHVQCQNEVDYVDSSIGT